MRDPFLFHRKKKKQETGTALFVLLVGLAAAGLLGWVGWGKGGGWWNGFGWLAGLFFMAINSAGLAGDAPEEAVPDTPGEWRGRCLAVLLNCTAVPVLYLFNVACAFYYSRTDLGLDGQEGAFLSPLTMLTVNPLEGLIGLGLIALGLYLALKQLRWLARAAGARRRARRDVVQLEGPDGKKYPLPRDEGILWSLYRKTTDLEGSWGVPSQGSRQEALKPENFAKYLLVQRLADVMYEQFRKGQCTLAYPPEDSFSEEQWAAADKAERWATYAHIMESTAAVFWERWGQYDRARTYADRMLAIALAVGTGNDYDMIDVKRAYDIVYRHFPEAKLAPDVQERVDTLCARAQARRDKRAEELHRYEAEAPERARRNAERRLEYEEAQLRRQMAAEKRAAQEQKLRDTYEDKLRGLDARERVLNAALDHNTYTNEENYLAGNLGDQEYARRKFLRDEAEEKYRKEYESALADLDDD